MSCCEVPVRRPGSGAIRSRLTSTAGGAIMLCFGAGFAVAQTPGLIPPNLEQQGIPRIQREDAGTRKADESTPPPREPTLPNQTLSSPIARIDVRSAILASEIEALLGRFIGKTTLTGEELARAQGEIWTLLREHGRMTRVELQATSGSEAGGGSVLLATVHEITVRSVLVHQENGTELDKATLDRILADARVDIADGGILDLDRLDSRIRRRLFLRDVDVRAELVPVGVDRVDVKIMVAAKPRAPMGMLAQADNYGMSTYGRPRYTLGLSIPGRIIAGDQFDALTINSSRMNYGRLAYDVPLVPLGARLNSFGAVVAYRAPSGQKGRMWALGTGLSYPVHIGDQSVWIVQLNYLHRQQTDELSGLGRIADKEVNDFQGKLDVTYSPAANQTLYATSALTFGDLDLSALPSALAQDQISARSDGRFTKFEWTAGWNVLFGRNGGFDAGIAATGQLASKNLDQSEKFSLGGPLGIRAFGPAEGLGDEGYVVNAELGYRPKSWLRAFTFYGVGRTRPYAKPWAIQPIPDEYALQGAGFGLSASSGPAVVEIIYARQIGGNPGLSSNGLDSDGMHGRHRIWLSVSFRL